MADSARASVLEPAVFWDMDAGPAGEGLYVSGDLRCLLKRKFAAVSLTERRKLDTKGNSAAAEGPPF